MHAYIQIHQRIANDGHTPVDDKVFLDFDQRKKYRLKTTSEQGNEVRIFLERDKAMQTGDLLVSECGKHFLIAPSKEPVVIATTDDWLAFAKVCYHLGNRHLSIQVGEREMRFKPDHVIEELAESFGLTLERTEDFFEPESGAYAKAGHGHHHDHSH